MVQWADTRPAEARILITPDGTATRGGKAQACGYIRSTSISVKAYVDLFRTRRKALWQDEHAPPSYELTVATTWEVALEKIPQASVDLLRLCSHPATRIVNGVSRWGRRPSPSPLPSRPGGQCTVSRLETRQVQKLPIFFFCSRRGSCSRLCVLSIGGILV